MNFKKFLGTGNTFLLLLLFFVHTSSFAQEIESIRKTFSGYKSAVIEGNGPEAVRWVDNTTLSYYDRILQTSIKADSAKIQSLNILDKLMVFTVRHRIPPEEILAMKGDRFFVYAIEKNMIAKSSVASLELGEVTLNDKTATGQLIVHGQKSPLNFIFNKESGIWKIDITSLFPVINDGLTKAIGFQGGTDSQFIFESLEALTGEPVSPRIWRPLK
jgi:hypothetical protein